MDKKQWINRRRAQLYQGTAAERAACDILTKMGIKFVRQKALDTGRHIYFADIYIPSLRLVLEIDGGYHNTQRQRRLDGNRSSAIRRLGLHVYRLPNRDARNPAKIEAKLRRLIKR